MYTVVHSVKYAIEDLQQRFILQLAGDKSSHASMKRSHTHVKSAEQLTY